jgi:O-antigen/teichoic acid export membrane protein
VLLIREFIGEEEAGKFGMTHKILEMILFLGATAFTTGAHQLGKCYAANDKNEFWRIGKKLIQSGLLIVTAASTLAWLGLHLATLIGLQFPHRMVSSPILAIMLVTTLIVCLNWGMEILIRSNGEEMLWPQYLARAVVCLPLLGLAIQYAGLMGAALVLFAIPLCLVLPWNLSLLRSFKCSWNSCQ